MEKINDYYKRNRGCEYKAVMVISSLMGFIVILIKIFG